MVLGRWVLTLCVMLLVSSTAFAQPYCKSVGTDEMDSDCTSQDVKVLGFGQKGLVLIRHESMKEHDISYVKTYGAGSSQCVDLYKNPERFVSCSSAVTDELREEILYEELSAASLPRLKWYRSGKYTGTKLKKARIRKIKITRPRCKPVDDECITFNAKVQVKVGRKVVTLSGSLSPGFHAMTGLPKDLCPMKTTRAFTTPNNSHVFVVLDVRGMGCQYDSFVLSKELNARAPLSSKSSFDLQSACVRATDNVLKVMTAEMRKRGAPKEVIRKIGKDKKKITAKCVEQTRGKPNARGLLKCMSSARSTDQMRNCSVKFPAR